VQITLTEKKTKQKTQNRDYPLQDLVDIIHGYQAPRI